MAVKPYVVGVSGASGAILARRCIEMLLQRDLPVVMTASEIAGHIWRQELDAHLEEDLAAWDDRVRYYPASHMAAPIASGSCPTAGMIVIPCSMATLSAIAHGSADNLLTRAADVCMKEGRRLVLVPRETPLSAIHLENMLSLAQLGARIVPPVPGFYHRPREIADLVDFMVGRALEALGIPDALSPACRYTPEEEWL